MRSRQQPVVDQAQLCPEEMTRAERVAIMVVCGNATEDEAQRFCDRFPEFYGVRVVEAVQTGLF